MRDPRKQQRIDLLQHRLARTDRKLVELKRIESRFPWLRLGALGASVLIVVLVFEFLPDLLGWLTAGLALIAFVLVMVRHQRIIDIIDRFTALRGLIAGQIARAELDWQGIPVGPPFPADAEHPYALDLDIPRLQRLMDTCASLGGSLRLSGWLAERIPDLPSIARRQALVRELLSRPALRTRLLVDGALINPRPEARWDGAQVLGWLDAHNIAGLLPYLLLAGLLALVNIVLFLLNAFSIIPAWWIFSLGAYLFLQSFKFRESSEVFNEAYTLARQLDQLRGVLTGLQHTPRRPGSGLSELLRPFYAGTQPSRALRKMGLIVIAASLRNNPLLAVLLNLLVPWDMFFAYQLEQYKVELRKLLPDWLAAWYKFEALNALAGFADLNSESTFPELSPQPAHTNVLKAIALGHPLIPDRVRVDNDFQISQLGDVVIITGSNMSGKSTFLRTVGINLVLAYAGTTVMAEHLSTIPFRLFTSMTLADSLSDGISFFYAEVRRLKALLDQLNGDHPLPLFFLVDEIFRGTNNRERQIGSHAYAQALAGTYGAGLISTHDLELVHLAEIIPQVRNEHFREEIQDGQMVFDYKIRPGSSPTTNALRIMALAGLPVPQDLPADLRSAGHTAKPAEKSPD